MKKKSFAKVIFAGIGGFQEKFISDILKENIDISDLTIKNGILYGKVSAHCYLYLSRKARKYGIRTRIHKRVGPYFKVRFLFRRWGLITGFLSCCLTIIILSGFVWDIRITGNNSVTDEQLMRVLSDTGVYIGVQRLSFDSNVCEVKVKNDIPELSWISIEREGSRVFVKVSEVDSNTEEELSIDEPCNIVADFDGQLTEAIVEKGQLVVQKGSGVKKGDLIVSGVFPDNGGHMMYVHSEGRFTAVCDEKEEFFIPFRQTVKIPTGERHTSSYFVIGGASLPIPWDSYTSQNGDDFKYSEETYNINLFGIEMPFKKRIGTYTFMTEKEIVYSNSDVMQMLKKAKTDFEENLLSDIRILNSEKQFIPEDNGIRLIVDYKLERQIGKKQKISITY